MNDGANKRDHRGLRRIFHAFCYSMNGIKSCFRTEEAFRQELIAAMFLLPLGLYFGDGAVEKFLLSSSVLFVLLVEILNTGIERTIDRISFDEHNLSKDAKDMGSAAVMLSLVICGLCWGLIFLL